MSDAPRDYLLGRIEQLERSNRRWKLLALALAFGLGFVVLLGGAFTAAVTLRAARQAQVERQRALEARDEAEMRRWEAEQRSKEAQEKARKP